MKLNSIAQLGELVHNLYEELEKEKQQINKELGADKLILAIHKYDFGLTYTGLTEEASDELINTLNSREEAVFRNLLKKYFGDSITY